MRKKLPRGAAWLLLALLLTGYALCSLARVEPLLQYACAAPAQAGPKAQDGDGAAEPVRPNGALSELSDSLDAALADLSGSVDFAALCAEAYPIDLAAGKQGAQVKLHAVGRRYFELYPQSLLYGRLPFPEEYRSDAERVAVVSDALALQLFGTAQALDRTFAIGEISYRVIGVTRRARAVGEQTRLDAYAPLAALADAPVNFQTATVTARPIPKAGAAVFFKSAMENWRPGGACYDLQKECLRAALLPRCALAILALWLAAQWLRRAAAYAAKKRADLRGALGREYLRALLGRILLGASTAALNFAGALALGAASVYFLVQPVYSFPEWVPAVLLGWTEIEQTFWSLMEGYAAPITFLTSAVARIRYFSALAHVGTAAALLAGLCMALNAKTIRAKVDGP